MSNSFPEIAGWFSVWHIIRATGLTAYILLFISTATGIIQSTQQLIPKQLRPFLFNLHNTTGWIGFLIGLTHGLTLLFDDYVGFSVREILLPLASDFKPLETGAGTVALYIIFLLMFSFDLIKRTGRKFWRIVHYSSFSCYFLALYHGIAIGTDTGEAVIYLMYITTAAIIAFLLLMRLFLIIYRKGVQRATSVSRR